MFSKKKLSDGQPFALIPKLVFIKVENLKSLSSHLALLHLLPGHETLSHTYSTPVYEKLYKSTLCA